jgi:hypothetical protein
MDLGNHEFGYSRCALRTHALDQKAQQYFAGGFALRKRHSVARMRPLPRAE